MLPHHSACLTLVFWSSVALWHSAFVRLCFLSRSFAPVVLVAAMSRGASLASLEDRVAQDTSTFFDAVPLCTVPLPAQFSRPRSHAHALAPAETCAGSTWLATDQRREIGHRPGGQVLSSGSSRSYSPLPRSSCCCSTSLRASGTDGISGTSSCSHHVHAECPRRARQLHSSAQSGPA